MLVSCRQAKERLVVHVDTGERLTGGSSLAVPVALALLALALRCRPG